MYDTLCVPFLYVCSLIEYPIELLKGNFLDTPIENPLECAIHKGFYTSYVDLKAPVEYLVEDCLCKIRSVYLIHTYAPL